MEIIVPSSSVAKPAIIALPGYEKWAEKLNAYLIRYGKARCEIENAQDVKDDTYIVNAQHAFYFTGESRCIIRPSEVQGRDVYILCDFHNNNERHCFNLHGCLQLLSPDIYYALLRETVLSIKGLAKRITAVLPTLYNSFANSNPSYPDNVCTYCLNEMYYLMGIDRIVAFNVDENIKNSVSPDQLICVSYSYQMMKKLAGIEKNVCLDSEHLLFMAESVYKSNSTYAEMISLSDIFQSEKGLIIAIRDKSRVVEGANPIVKYELSVSDVKGKDVIIIADISSDDSMMNDCAYKLKEMGASRVFIFTSYLETGRIDYMDKAYSEGAVNRIYCLSNGFVPDELTAKEWLVSVDTSKFLSYVIDSLNYDAFHTSLLDYSERMNRFIEHYNQKSGE